MRINSFFQMPNKIYLIKTYCVIKISGVCVGAEWRVGKKKQNALSPINSSQLAVLVSLKSTVPHFNRLQKSMRLKT